MAGRGLASLASAGQEGEEFNVIEAIGGVRGVVESMLPGVVFVVVYLVSGQTRLTVIVSAVLAVAQLLVRLAQRQSLMGCVSGLVSVGICLVWVWTSHEARNYYVLGFITNAVYAVVLAVSVALRRPGVGVVVEWFRSTPTSNFGQWMRDWVADEPLRRAYTRVSLLWVGLFVLRLLVQVPLYSADAVGWLAAARLVMGIPMWALCIWVSYLMIADPFHAHTVQEYSEQEGQVQESQAQDQQECQLHIESEERSK